MTNLVSKISVKSVVGSIELEEKSFTNEKGESNKKMVAIKKQIMQVAGVCTDYGVKNSQYGDSIEFHGEFAAVNMETGEAFSAGKAFLPKIAETYLATIVDNVEGNLEFAFEIGVAPANTPMGYEYTVKPLIEQQTKPKAFLLLDAVKSKPALAVIPDEAA